MSTDSEKRVQIAVSNSESQLDDDCDDCVSENSFGSYLSDNAMDEEDMTAGIELDSSLPVYSDEECPLSTSILDNMYVKSPSVVLQYTPLPPYTPPTRSTQPAFEGPSICIVCKLSPAYRKGKVSYPTCGLTCASKMSNAPSSASQSEIEISYSMKRGSVSQSGGGANQNMIKMCEVCHVRPQAQKAGKIYPTCGFTCAATLTSNPISKGDVPTLDPLEESFQKLSLSEHSPGTRHYSQGHSHWQSPRGTKRAQAVPTNRHRISQVHQPLKCVVCRKPCRDGRYVTCGMKCAEALCTRGNSNPILCDYCHRRPKVPGHNQCGETCRDNASTACLLCRCRPKLGRYHLCGRTCKMIATKRTPLILEARPDHITYIEVQKRFKRAWKGIGVCPTIKKVYKIIENKSFLLPYDQYKRRVENEVFRYHGTSRRCTLGSPGNTRLCPSTACALCSILRTSFKVSLASPSGAFGSGVYTSSAANKAYSYSNDGRGAIILTKVVLGTVYKVKAFNAVMTCPPGYNSVVYNRQNGTLNETIVYTDDAIRPVFLITF